MYPFSTPPVLSKLKLPFLLFLLLFSLSGNSAFGQKTILWSVKDTVSGHQSYLVGTMHQTGNGWIDSLTILTDRLLNADLGVFESVDPSGEVAKIINAREEKYHWLNSLNRKDMEQIQSYAPDWPVDIEKLRPIELTIKLNQMVTENLCGSVRPGDTHSHFDNYLQFLRDSLDLDNIGLETDSAQTEMIFQEFDSTDIKGKLNDIHYQLKLLRKGKYDKHSCGFITDYLHFRFEDYPLQVKCQDDLIIKKRNDAWMDILPELLRSQNCFIAVGLKHLFFECGLIQSLRREGFIVEPIIGLAKPNN